MLARAHAVRKRNTGSIEYSDVEVDVCELIKRSRLASTDIFVHFRGTGNANAIDRSIKQLHVARNRGELRKKRERERENRANEIYYTRAQVHVCGS